MYEDQAPQTTIEDLENTLRQNEFMVAQCEALERLLQNDDFKKVIREGYMKTFAHEQVLARANPQLQSDERQRSILRNIDGVAALHDFMDLILIRGDQAKYDIEEVRKELDNERNVEQLN